LRVGEFDAIAGSSLISILGDSAAYLAVTVLVYQRTGSALLSALTFAVAFVPYLIGGTLLSALVDRLHPRALLIGSDLVGAAVIAAIAAPGVPVPFLFVALFVIGSIAPVRSGTAGAIVADVLPGDTFVVSWSQSSARAERSLSTVPASWFPRPSSHCGCVPVRPAAQGHICH
jgi:MFS family permease